MRRAPSALVPSALLPLALAVAALSSACGGEPDAPAEAPAQASPAPVPGATVLRGPEARVYAIEGLSGPEAVKYDPDQDVWFVSNFGPDEDPEANDGFIARVAAEDGAVEVLRWAVGEPDRPLQEPRGMALAGDTLWVADARGLHAFDRRSGASLRFVDLTALEPGFLNDVTVGADGGVYVTDTGTSSLIRLTGTGGVVVAEGEALGSPNGVTTDPVTGVLVLVPWAGGDSLRAWDPVTRALSIRARSPGSRFDGVEFLGTDLVVASQGDSALHVVRGAVGVPFQKLPGAPADIALDARRGRIAVPYIALNRVDVYPVPGGG